MKRDEQLLADIPDFLSFDMMLKATPSDEGGKRFIYFEASNEGVDQQGERVLAKALAESTDFFLKFGNIDIDHYTILGPKIGMKDAMSYEVGRPVAVDVKGEKTFVKAELYQGSGPLAEQANMVWESMTQLNPPARWYPSVGGAVLAKSIQIDPDTKNKVAVIDRVRWSNVGLSRTPVNQHLPCATATPVGTFAKSLNGFVVKALEASYSTDVASLSGGGAFGMQSLDTGTPYSYHDFRERLSDALQKSLVQSQTEDGMTAYAVNEFNLSPETAADWVNRFLGDLKSNLSNRRLQ
jgi:hypothetical protein